MGRSQLTTTPFRSVVSVCLLLIFVARLHADDTIPQPQSWFLSVTPQMLYGSYSTSATRKSLQGASVALQAEYLERGGVTVTAGRSSLTFRQSTSTIEQNNVAFSGWYNLTPDSLPGTLTLSATAVAANNNDQTNETDEVRVAASQIGFFPYDKSYYLDVGVAFSRYGDSSAGNGTLSVTQLTPTVATTLFGGSDWLQAKLFAMQFSNEKRAHNLSTATALQLQWTHYLVGGGWQPTQFSITGLAGKRIYVVEGSAVFNLADMQTGGVAAAVQWQPVYRVVISLQGGYDRYTVATTNVDYAAYYLYSSVEYGW